MKKVLKIIYKYENKDINDFNVIAAFIEDVVFQLIYIYNLESYITNLNTYNDSNPVEDLTYFSIINNLLSINIVSVTDIKFNLNNNNEKLNYLIKLTFIILHEISHALEFKKYNDHNINSIEYHLSNIFNRKYYNDEYIRSSMNITGINIEEYDEYNKNLNLFLTSNNILDPNEIVANNFAFKKIIKILKADELLLDENKLVKKLYYEYSLSFYKKNNSGITNYQLNQLMNYKDYLDKDFYPIAIKQLLKLANNLSKKQKLYYSFDLTNEEYEKLLSKSKKFH